MNICEVHDRTLEFLRQLLVIWEASVRATHLFLSDAEVRKIKEYVPHALAGVSRLVIAERKIGCPVAFMGVEGQRLEMLFLSPEERGAGLGRQLLVYGIRRYGICEVTVNEQTPRAAGFYEHMGFTVYKRTDHDEAGDPYPLLYMKRIACQ